MGVERLSLLQARKLLIPRSDKTPKNDRNAEVRYTSGIRTLAPESACWDRQPLEHIMERAGEVEVNASSVVAAVQAYAKINAQG